MVTGPRRRSSTTPIRRSHVVLKRCRERASWRWRRVALGLVADLIIINQSAARARRSWPTIKSQLDAAGIEYQAYETKAPGDATIKTRAALQSGVESVVCVGGDGTLSEVVEGFFELHDDLDVLPSAINPSATLSLLPAGTGDDFARGLYGRRSPLEESLATFLAYARGDSISTARSVDVLYGRCDGYEKPFICLNALRWLREAIHLSQRVDDGNWWRDRRTRRRAGEVHAQLLGRVSLRLCGSRSAG